MTAKKRLIRNIIIAVVALALLGGAYFLLLKWEPDNQDKADAPSTKRISIVSEKEEDIASISIKNERGEYSLIRTDKGEGAAQYTIAPTDKENLEKEMIELAFKSLLDISAIREIDAEGKTIADFGLDKPIAEVVLTAHNGAETKIVFGGETPSGNEYYCKRIDDSKIYTVSGAFYELAMRDVDSYRNKNVLQISDLSSISSFKIYKENAPLLAIRHTTEEENKNKVMAMGWTMEYPWVAELANDRTSALLSKFAVITANGFAEANDVNLEYRLDVVSGDKEYSFNIGCDADANTRIKDNSTGIIYISTQEIYNELTKINPSDYISKFVNLVNVKNVSKVTVKCNGKEYVMETGGENKPYKINGSEVQEEKFVKEYQDVIGISFIEYISNKPTGAPYMTIEFELNDGSFEKTSFYDVNEREYAAVLSNGSAVRLLKSEINNLQKKM